MTVPSTAVHFLKSTGTGTDGTFYASAVDDVRRYFKSSEYPTLAIDTVRVH